jgi:hypothetical protein
MFRKLYLFPSSGEGERHFVGSVRANLNHCSKGYKFRAIISPLIGPNILGTLFSNTLSLYSSLRVRNQVSHPYKTSGNIREFCTLTSSISDGKKQESELDSPNLICSAGYLIKHTANFTFLPSNGEPFSKL